MCSGFAEHLNCNARMQIQLRRYVDARRVPGCRISEVPCESWDQGTNKQPHHQRPKQNGAACATPSEDHAAGEGVRATQTTENRRRIASRSRLFTSVSRSPTTKGPTTIFTRPYLSRLQDGIRSPSLSSSLPVLLRSTSMVWSAPPCMRLRRRRRSRWRLH